MTYPKFVEKHYPPTKSPVKSEDVEKELYLEAENDIDLNDIENYLTNIEYVKKDTKGYKLKSEEELVKELEDDTDLERLTDTTQTIVVEDKDEPKKERVLRYDKTSKGRKKV